MAISVRRYARGYVGNLLLSLLFLFLFFSHSLTNTKLKHVTSTYHHYWYLVHVFVFSVSNTKGHFTRTGDWEPVTITLQALSSVEKAGPVQVRFTLRLRDHRDMWMQDGCKVYMDSYMASNGSCFMVTWIIFKNHLLEVGLTQNRDHDSPNTRNHCFFYFIICENLHE